MNNATILILGAGYTGKKLARMAIDRGYDVIATTRDGDTAALLNELGARAVEWSVGDDPLEWGEFVDESTHVVYSIPTLYSEYESGEGDRLPRHVRPVADVVDICQKRSASRLVYLSSTSVYGDHEGRWVDENTPRRPSSPYGKMRADIEDYLRRQDVEPTISVARLVGIYGPGRTMVDSIQSGRYRLVDGGKKVTNRIHVHDIARAILAIIERGPRQFRTFNITDGHPQSVRDLVEFICDVTGIDAPPEERLQEYARRKQNPNAVARWKNTVRVRNDRLRRELDFELVYPDPFAGYQAILEESSS